STATCSSRRRRRSWNEWASTRRSPRARSRSCAQRDSPKGPGSGACLKVGRDPGFGVERGLYDFVSCWFWSASGRSREAVEVACLGRVVGAVGAAASRSAPSLPFPGPVALSGAGVFGGDLVRAVHG